LEWFGEKLRLMLTFEGDPMAAEYLLDKWPESLPYMAHTPKPTIPVFVVRAVAAHPQASQGAGCGHTSQREGLAVGLSTMPTIGEQQTRFAFLVGAIFQETALRPNSL